MGAERRLSQRIGETGLRAGRSATADQRVEGIAILSQDFDRLAANEGEPQRTVRGLAVRAKVASDVRRAAVPLSSSSSS